MRIANDILKVILDVGITLFEYMGFIIIVFSGVTGFINYARRDSFTRLKLAKGMALGLEFKLGAEILRTVLMREWNDIIIVGAIILLRGALAFLIHWEIKNQESEYNLSESINKMEEEIYRIKNQVHVIEEHERDLEEHVQTIEKQERDLEEQVQNMEKHERDLVEAVQSIEEQVQVIEDQVSDIEEQVSDIEDQVSDMSTTLTQPEDEDEADSES